MPDKPYILVFDHGTTSIRACLMDKAGQIVAIGQSQFEQIYPQPGWVEHNANTLWDLTLKVAKDAFTEADCTWKDIASIGITNQRETVVLWNKTTGEPVHNAIVWQCRRTTDYCNELKANGLGKSITQKTGLVIDPYFSASKIKWLFDNVSDAKPLAEKGELLFGTVDTWILWKLTGGDTHATDYSNASRTMLFNIHSKNWDEELLALFDVPRALLPDVKASKDDYGNTLADLTGGESIPIGGVIGDQQAALFGQKCWKAGSAKSTYGTGAFLVMNTGDEAVTSKGGLLTTLAADENGQPCYAMEGAIFNAGATLEWLEKKLKLFNHPSECDGMATSIDNNGGVYLVPAFAGLGAPHWDANARGLISGLTQDTTPSHLVRAGLEAMVYQTKEVLDTMQTEAGLDLTTLKIDGGVSRSAFMTQFLANMLGLTISRSDDAELTAKGAGYLAGLHSGFWESPDAIRTLSDDQKTVAPEPSFTMQQRGQLMTAWERVIQRTLSDGEKALVKA